jgi:transposase
VIDNLSAHKGDRVRAFVEARGWRLMYLLAYSPDLNPLEEAFAKVKSDLRKAEVRSGEALIEAMGRALDGITPEMRGASSSTADTEHRVNRYN